MKGAAAMLYVRGSPPLSGSGRIETEVGQWRAKQLAQEVPPDDCSLEDIQYHLHVRQLIDEGREDIRQGRVVSQEEIERDLAHWPGK